MKKIFIISFFAMLAVSSPLFATGFGIYGTGGIGKADMLSFHHDGDYTVNYSLKNSFYGGGILLESGDDAAGYHNRLSLGLEGITAYGGVHQYRMLIRPHLNNVFAFKIAGNESFRFWIGPMLGINLLTGLIPTTRHHEWSFERNRYSLAALGSSPSQLVQAYGLYYIYYDHIWERTVGVSIPIGLVIGINVKLGESAAFTLEAGFRCGLFVLTKTGFNYEGYANAGFIFGAI